ncbi:MAG: hypothetical protein WC102_09155, partial [Saccharofermentanales bacterium]
MDSRERVIKVLNFEEVDRLPRNLWVLPGVEMFRKNELDEFLDKYPDDFTGPDYKYGTGKRCKGDPNMPGEYTDAWGSVWHVAEHG